MDAMERLKGAMVRVEALVSFYQGHLSTTLDNMELITPVTIRDLKALLDALADRDISLQKTKHKPLYDRERQGEKTYADGYRAGRNEEIRRCETFCSYVKGLINGYLRDREREHG